jgi:hypothetical protein
VKLFDIAKVPCYCDGVTHSIEKRRGEDVKVLTLSLKVAPFDAKLATVMPDGVKPTLFKLNSGDPKETLRRADFALGVERQQLHVFASPDTDAATRMLDQVRIHGTYANMAKDRNSFDFKFKATFGPVGRDELEFIQSWLLTQKFVTFDAAEPGMFDEMVDDGETDEDVKAREVIDGRKPVWDDEPAAAAPSKAKPATERAHRSLHSHQGKKKTTGKRKGRK